MGGEFSAAISRTPLPQPDAPLESSGPDQLKPRLIRSFRHAPLVEVNCWYFGPSVSSTDEYIVVCGRSCGANDYHAEWRFFPARRMFELVVMNYGTGANPKKIAECQAFYQVLTYIMNNRDPHDISFQSKDPEQVALPWSPGA